MLWHLVDLLAVGEVVRHLTVLVSERSDVLDGQALVGRDCDVAHVLAIDALLLSTDQVLEEVDCHLL